MSFTPKEREIARQLGVLPCSVAILVEAAAKPDGLARGGYASKKLAEDGFLKPATVDNGWSRPITPLGRQLADKARKLGW